MLFKWNPSDTYTEIFPQNRIFTIILNEEIDSIKEKWIFQSFIKEYYSSTLVSYPQYSPIYRVRTTPQDSHL